MKCNLIPIISDEEIEECRQRAKEYAGDFESEAFVISPLAYRYPEKFVRQKMIQLGICFAFLVLSFNLEYVAQLF